MSYYYSPFHFLPSDVGPNADAAVIQRAKKRLLAEIEMDSSNFGDVTKDELLKRFDALDPSELPFHRFIFNQKPLLNFLERGEIPSSTDWYPRPENTTHAFIQPLIQHRYERQLTEAFRSADVASVSALAKLRLPDLELKGRYYYAGTLNFLTGYYQQLQQILSDWSLAKRKDLVDLLSSPVLRVIPSLPPYFNAMRDEFALTLMKFAGQICEKPEGKEIVELARQINEVSSRIVVSPQAVSSMNAIRKDQIFTDEVAAIDPTIKDASASTRRGCAKAFFIFFLVTMIIRIIAAIIR